MTSRGRSSYRETPQNQRLDFIEGMRALCALYVVLGHIANLVDPSRAELKPSKAPLWMQQIFRPFQEGHLAVAAFIVISGFCLAHAAYARNDAGVKEVGAFLIRRFKRILPAYYGCLVVSVLVSLWVTVKIPRMPFLQYVPVTKENLLAHVFLVQNLRPEWMYKLNGVLWSIAIEFQLYFTFPVLMRLIRARGWVFPIVLTACIAYAVTNYIPHGIKLYAWFLPLFLLGMVGARFAQRKYLRPEFIVVSLVCMAAAAYVAMTSRWTTWLSDSLFAVPVLAALVAGSHFVKRRIGLFAFLESRWLVLIGSFSYSLYLFHHPILQVVYHFRPKHIVDQTGLLLFLLVFGLPCCLIGAFAMGWLFERKWVIKAWERIWGVSGASSR